MRTAWSWILVGALTSTPALARQNPRYSNSPSRAAVPFIGAVAIPAGAVPIHIDGELSDPVWALAAPVNDFRQREPTEGAPATHETQVRIAYDSTALYIAVRALDPEPDRLVGLLTRRDDDSPSDWVAVLVDSFHDRRTAYEFGVNASGVKYDRYWFNDSDNDRSWDAVWDAAVTRTRDGWQAEFRVPFSQLRFRAGETGPLGFAAVRTVAHVHETSTWPLLAKSATGFVSSFGELQGVAVAPGQKKLELMPYLSSQASTAPVPAGSPLAKSPDFGTSAGVDLRYRVAPGLSLTAAVNPDFGQVEADPAVVNLGAFETFFSERRPFFVEGSGNFSFNNLFYSRRIGRAPQHSADAPEQGFSRQPTNTTILGAAKLTGRVGAFSVGVLNAVTAAEYGRVAPGPAKADITRTPVEPLTTYTVGRASREFADSSRLSFMVTHVNRALKPELQMLADSALAGGVDWDWRTGPANQYSISGSWTGSTVRGSEEAIDRLQRSNVHGFQRPDATSLTYDPARTRLDGHSGSLSIGKIGGQRTRLQVNGGYRSPGFETNDLGFQPRADEIWQNSWFQVRNETPGRYLRSFRFNINQWAGWNFDGDRRELGGNVNAHWVLKNSVAFGTGFNVNTEGFADRLTRGGPGGLMPGNLNGWAYLDSDNRHRLVLNLYDEWYNDRHGSHSWFVSQGVTIRPSSGLSFSVNLETNRNLTAQQWVENVTEGTQKRYVFGRLEQTTVSVGTRLNYTIRPTLTLQLYARPFVSAGAYSAFTQLVDGRAPDFASRFAPASYGGTPDFNVESFRTTNVLRWEYRPGSALFVVWQQGREGFVSQGDFRFGRDLGRTFSAPAENVLLIKISRWLNF
ncbi:MAG: DUF5916 domain-containing protein [Vicinamibacterales bacterium]